MKIENLSSLASQIGLQDRAELAPVEVRGITQQRHRAVWNINQDKVATIVSDNYKVIQHSDVLQAVTETLGRLNLNVSGRFDNWGNRIRADLIFQDKEPIRDDSQDGVMIGIRVLNSYDKTTSFRLDMYGFRVVCQNGMSLGKVMNQVREVTFHTGDEKPYEKICQITEGFVKDVINSSVKLQEYVNRAIGDSLEWEMVDKIMAGLIHQKKHREIITKLLNSSQPLSRWELYNGITNYLTHGKQLTPGVQAYLETRAERVLRQSKEQLAVAVEETTAIF